MSANYEKLLAKWTSAQVMDAATAERIRAYEVAEGSGERLRWPVLVALALGGLLIAAAVLLFVSAHWDELSPGARFALVLLMVALFPAAGAVTAERFHAFSVTFYAIGTMCTGAGIFLAAQTFNLEEHWPSGILLWAIGALAGWLLLRNWTQAAMLALLVPAWLVGEWEVKTRGFTAEWRAVPEGLLLLALTYLSAHVTDEHLVSRKALVWIGGLALFPVAIWAFVTERGYSWRGQLAGVSAFSQAGAWAIAIGAPLVLAYLLRKSAAWMNLAAAVWALVIGTFHSRHRGTGSFGDFAWNSVGVYLWAGLGAIGLVAWGMAEQRKERVNLGIVGFGLTAAIFYFSDVMDKLGRSASLAGLGILLLLGGWSLEKTRRRLVVRISGGAR